MTCATATMRAGLGHSKAREDVDPGCQSLLRQCLVQLRSANDHLQSTKMSFGGASGVEQHFKKSRYAMREGDALSRDQSDDQFRVVAARVDLLHAGKRRRPRKSPGVHVKHRRHRHIDVIAGEPPVLAGHAKQGQFGQAVENQLPMTVVDPFGQARCAGRVKGGCLGIFIEVRKAVVRR